MSTLPQWTLASPSGFPPMVHTAWGSRMFTLKRDTLVEVPNWEGFVASDIDEQGFSPDGKLFWAVAQSGTNTVYGYSVSKFRVVSESSLRNNLPMAGNNAYPRFCVSPDNKVIVASYTPAQVSSNSSGVPTGFRVARYSNGVVSTPVDSYNHSLGGGIDDDGEADFFAWSPDSTVLVVAKGNNSDEDNAQWYTKDPITNVLTNQGLVPVPGRLNRFGFSPDGLHFWFKSEQGRTQMTSVENGFDLTGDILTLNPELDGPQLYEPEQGFAWSLDNTLVAIGARVCPVVAGLPVLASTIALPVPSSGERLGFSFFDTVVPTFSADSKYLMLTTKRSHPEDDNWNGLFWIYKRTGPSSFSLLSPVNAAMAADPLGPEFPPDTGSAVMNTSARF